MRFGFGLVCVPEGSSTTVVWSPLTDANAPWFVYQSGLVAYEEMVIDVVDVPTISGARYVIDSKAMRKCPPDMEMQAVFEQSDVSGTRNINMLFSGRILLGR